MSDDIQIRRNASTSPLENRVGARGTALALRMDDVGASSKRFEVYSNHSFVVGDRVIGYGNWLFLKRIEPFRKWGPYREILATEWNEILSLLDESGARLTVGLTAAWAESEDRLVPFPEKFPEEASVLKRGVQSGLIEIANHGLTHCVLAGNGFKPRLFSGNRSQHREFWEWLPTDVHETHIARSQEILHQWLGADVVTFVPPGNVYAPATVTAAFRHGLKYLSCMTEPGKRGGVTVVGNSDVVAFHDRDIVLNGINWLRRLITQHADHSFCFVRELGERMEKAQA